MSQVNNFKTLVVINCAIWMKNFREYEMCSEIFMSDICPVTINTIRVFEMIMYFCSVTIKNVTITTAITFHSSNPYKSCRARDTYVNLLFMKTFIVICLDFR